MRKIANFFRMTAFVVLISFSSFFLAGCAEVLALTGLIGAIGGAVGGIGAIFSAFGNQKTGGKLQQVGAGLNAIPQVGQVINTGYNNIASAASNFIDVAARESLARDRARVPSPGGDPDAAAPAPAATAQTPAQQPTQRIQPPAQEPAPVMSAINQVAQAGDAFTGGMTRVTNAVNSVAQAGNQVAQGVVQTTVSLNQMHQILTGK
ncbi:MAG: hypothetical protein HQM10_18875 [Candidatus Riflebacteria bacterium]|nr:hypothetical protein [Candidatus Riflebacteria bacterium]